MQSIGTIARLYASASSAVGGARVVTRVENSVSSSETRQMSFSSDMGKWVQMMKNFCVETIDVLKNCCS